MKKDINREVYFTPKQAAEHFNLSLSTIKNYIYAGKLKTLRTPGGHHRIRRSDFLATLGDKITQKKEATAGDLKNKLSAAILMVFKAFGPSGDLLMQHAKRVAYLSVNVARAMEMSEDEIETIRIASLLHDIGNIGLEKRLLFKKDILSPDEYEIVKSHPEIGEKLLNSVKELKYIAEIIAQHHERVDGEGYPRGIKGEYINKAACIISIAEAYDSMISQNSYKRQFSKEEAIKELARNKNTQFDGEIVDVFTRVL